MTEHIREVLKCAKCVFTEIEVEAALDNMATQIKKRVGNSNPIFLCVLVGGIIPLGNLLTRLDFPLEMDYIHVSRYGDKTHGSEISWKAKPVSNLQGRTVVIVDDILDEGVTLATAVEYCRSCGAKEILTAVLVDKKKERSPGGIADADFKGLEVENFFVFGYGLDYNNYLRNAPGIYITAPKHAHY
jgi:hypoxanthine phosphoribosyltransferase